MQERSRLEKKIERQELFQTQIDDAGVLFEFAEEDDTSIKELHSLLERLEQELGLAETEMLLAGENDRRNAICTIHPGAGGTESQDWAEMLLRMYLKWAEQRGFKTEILEYQPGEEAGLKSVTFRVEGEYAYGLLAAEAGVHRLVRISPFDQAARRHTSFASLFVFPEIDEDIEVEINDKDLRSGYLSSNRCRGPAHKYYRLRCAHHAPAHQYRRIVSEPAFATSEQGGGNEGPEIPAL